MVSKAEEGGADKHILGICGMKPRALQDRPSWGLYILSHPVLTCFSIRRQRRAISGKMRLGKVVIVSKGMMDEVDGSRNAS